MLRFTYMVHPVYIPLNNWNFLSQNEWINEVKCRGGMQGKVPSGNAATSSLLLPLCPPPLNSELCLPHSMLDWWVSYSPPPTLTLNTVFCLEGQHWKGQSTDSRSIVMFDLRKGKLKATLTLNLTVTLTLYPDPDCEPACDLPLI